MEVLNRTDQADPTDDRMVSLIDGLLSGVDDGEALAVERRIGAKDRRPDGERSTRRAAWRPRFEAVEDRVTMTMVSPRERGVFGTGSALDLETGPRVFTGPRPWQDGQGRIHRIRSDSLGAGGSFTSTIGEIWGLGLALSFLSGPYALKPSR